MKDPSYLRKVRLLPCAACLSDTSDQHRDPHHLMRGVNRGLSKKGPDNRVIPLCRKCHNLVHESGAELIFLANHHIENPVELSKTLFDVAADATLGRRAIIKSKIPKGKA